MFEFPAEIWIAVGLIIVVAVLSVLYSLASAIRIEVHIHDVRVQAAKLQRQYAQQVADLEASEELDDSIQIVGQGPIDPAAMAA